MKANDPKTTSSAKSENVQPVISVAPFKLHVLGRRAELEVRISIPLSGDELPVIIFAHGFGSSMDAYTPLVNYWAARGFAVIQPTFLDSRKYARQHHADHGDAVKAFLADPESKKIWHQRITDVKAVHEQLDLIEASYPVLKGRFDKNLITAVGHSFGAHTVASLLGAGTVVADASQAEDYKDERIKAGILLSAAGRRGNALSTFAIEHFPYLNTDYSTMTTPALVVAGDQDHSPLTVLGPEWFTDAYHLSPGADALLTLAGGEHMLGGISGVLVKETTDEDPDRVSIVQQVTFAYLRSFNGDSSPLWEDICHEYSPDGSRAGKIETK